MGEISGEEVLHSLDEEILRRMSLKIDGVSQDVSEECKVKLAYTCDKRACAVCKVGCEYTSNIEHARHFKRMGSVMVEE